MCHFSVLETNAHGTDSSFQYIEGSVRSVCVRDTSAQHAHLQMREQYLVYLNCILSSSFTTLDHRRCSGCSSCRPTVYVSKQFHIFVDYSYVYCITNRY